MWNSDFENSNFENQSLNFVCLKNRNLDMYMEIEDSNFEDGVFFGFIFY